MYQISRIFASLQWEGYGAGTPAVFVCFPGCERVCPYRGPACVASKEMAQSAIAEEVMWRVRENPGVVDVVLTGGDPCAQIDADLPTLIRNRLSLRRSCIKLETGGEEYPTPGFDWITVTPCADLTAILGRFAHRGIDELRIPFCSVEQLPRLPLPYAFQRVKRRYMVPVWNNSNDGFLSMPAERIMACVRFILDNPEWALSPWCIGMYLDPARTKRPDLTVADCVDHLTGRREG